MIFLHAGYVLQQCFDVAVPAHIETLAGLWHRFPPVNFFGRRHRAGRLGIEFRAAAKLDAVGHEPAPVTRACSPAYLRTIVVDRTATLTGPTMPAPVVFRLSDLRYVKQAAAKRAQTTRATGCRSAPGDDALRFFYARMLGHSARRSLTVQGSRASGLHPLSFLQCSAICTCTARKNSIGKWPPMRWPGVARREAVGAARRRDRARPRTAVGGAAPAVARPWPLCAVRTIAKGHDPRRLHLA
jgi:hypothetical protein